MTPPPPETDSSTISLPLEAYRAEFTDKARKGPVVLTAPTGSGKSTLVPQWCAELWGRVTVVEPRRVACRSLARRVASLRRESLGKSVGYSVRHERVGSSSVPIQFVTPGVALRMVADGGMSGLGPLVIDEAHERSIEVDLLLALARATPVEKLVVMSATVSAEAFSLYFDAERVEGKGRAYPVEVDYAGRPMLPSPRDLAARVVEAARLAAERPGDMLIFAPGKAEIAASVSALRGAIDAEVLPLHGSLPSAEQDRVFDPGARRRIVVATNVAETSVTIPRVGVVIDTGLVRQTRYHQGAGVLTLGAVAMDAAEQRRGRAGRVQAGHCTRLWSKAGQMAERTTPEILREDLDDFVLRLAGLGQVAKKLVFLDPPKPYALSDSTRALTRMGALATDGRITPVGERMARLPLSPTLARFLVAAGELGCLEDAIDLTAALDGGAPLILPARGRVVEARLELTADRRCDATLAVMGVREGRADQHGLRASTLAEARRVAKQLRRALGLRGAPEAGRPVDWKALATAFVRADRRAVFVRRRKGPAWTNGGTEGWVPKDSWIADTCDVVVAVDTHVAEGRGGRPQVSLSVALAATSGWLKGTDLGEWVAVEPRVQGGAIVCEMKRMYSWRLLSKREDVPTGAAAVSALVELVEQKRLFRRAWEASIDEMDAWNLYRRLRADRLTEDSGPVEPAAWLRERAESLGLESGADLALLSDTDFRFERLDSAERTWLDDKFPRVLDLGDSTYRVLYEPRRMMITLDKVRGPKGAKPNPLYLPSWPRWKVQVKDKNAVSLLRGR